MENTVEIQKIESATVVDITRETPTNDAHYTNEEALLKRLASLEKRIRFANNNYSKASEKIEKINEKCSSLLINVATKSDIANLKFYILSGLCISFALGSFSLGALVYLAKTL